jgi:hypothetical protein
MVYSEGVGVAWFNPVVNGLEMVPLEFTNVLYVPALCSYLFSVVFLKMHCHSLSPLSLTSLLHQRQQDCPPSKNWELVLLSAYLVGDAIPIEEFASLSSATTSH